MGWAVISDVSGQWFEYVLQYWSLKRERLTFDLVLCIVEIIVGQYFLQVTAAVGLLQVGEADAVESCQSLKDFSSFLLISLVYFSKLK